MSDSMAAGIVYRNAKSIGVAGKARGEATSQTESVLCVLRWEVEEMKVVEGRRHPRSGSSSGSGVPPCLRLDIIPLLPLPLTPTPFALFLIFRPFKLNESTKNINLA